MKLKLLLLSAFISLAGTAHAQRIVVLTPDTADIVAALGALDEIVGRDQTVQIPAANATSSATTGASYRARIPLPTKSSAVPAVSMPQPPLTVSNR